MTQEFLPFYILILLIMTSHATDASFLLGKDGFRSGRGLEPVVNFHTANNKIKPQPHGILELL